MRQLLKEIRHNPMLLLLAFVPVVLVAAKIAHEAHTLLFVLSILAIVPLAPLLSHLVRSRRLTAGDREDLRKLLDELDRKSKGKSGQ